MRKTALSADATLLIYKSNLENNKIKESHSWIRKFFINIIKNISLKRGKLKHELRVTSYEFKSTSHEFKSTSYEFKSTN